MTGPASAGRRSPLVRAGLVVAMVAASISGSCAIALGHASLVQSSPSADAKLAGSPERVTLTFTEPVQILRPSDVDVVDSEGKAVSANARVSSEDSRVIEVPLRGRPGDGTYTVRYQIIGADSHVIPGLYVFGLGAGELGAPYVAGTGTQGPSETSPRAVSARFLELVALGGLIGLLAFRWLVWAPVLGRGSRGGGGEGRQAVLIWGRDLFWMAFGVLAILAMVAEAYLLLVQSASVLGTDVTSAIHDRTGISEVLGNTRFGSLLQLRAGILFAVFALAAALFINEYGSARAPKAARPGHGALGDGLLGVSLLVAMGVVAAQGHPGVAAYPLLETGVQLVHLAGAAVWIAGLALIAAVFARVPRIAPADGPALAARLLARFSRVALAVVALVVLTGVVRSVSELSDPSELWSTDYGRSILYKLLLLCPIALLALFNRRIVVALRHVQRPNAATLRLVRRTAGAELALSIGIVVVASVLVAQVPGGS